MQMNKPVWIVEDKALKDSEEGRKKLQQVADDHDKPNTASRLTIVHGEDFDKVIAQRSCNRAVPLLQCESWAMCSVRHMPTANWQLHTQHRTCCKAVLAVTQHSL